MDSPVNNKRVRVDDSGSLPDSTESKRIRVDILESLEDSDELKDLDSFIKSFEEEISNSNPPENTTSGDRSSESGESRPEIEFLLEASDDELGLPPTESGVNELVGLSELNWYDDSFEYGFEYGELGVSVGVSDGYNNCESEYEVLDGLFDYTDLGLPAQ